jgi:aryl-alcohol dehydrogenase-like predicted oxidoreductase
LRAAIATTIACADKPEHLRANVRALEISFTPEELAALTQDFHERWGKIVRDLGMKPQEVFCRLR